MDDKIGNVLKKNGQNLNVFPRIVKNRLKYWLKILLFRRLWVTFVNSILFVSLALGLAACGTASPPLGLAPGGDILQKAIALQLKLSQQQLSEQLGAENPTFKITHVDVKQIEPIFIGKLPTYHFTGRYTLKLDLQDRKETQKGNEFDIYIQRQKEGKTWRWLRRETIAPDAPPKWFSYGIR